MTTLELYRSSTVGMCLIETLNEMVYNQVLTQFDESMLEALRTQVKSKVTIKGHLHSYWSHDDVWELILRDAVFKNEEGKQNVGKAKIVACNSKLFPQWKTKN
ncbi:hypothetical protein MKX03_012489 [Papaver bracteatum]|nr:hypothetical protein MKX03_012489 [Papaver bracteatum]